MEEQERPDEEQNDAAEDVEPTQPVSQEMPEATDESLAPTSIEEASSDIELPAPELPQAERELGELDDDESEEEPPIDVRAILRQARAAASVSEDGVESEAPEQVAEASESSDERAWYVIHCYSGYEKKVKHNLEQRIETMGMANQIFQVVVPTEDEIEVKEGKRRTVERRVFPGYILVQMAMNDDSWYVVRNTPGVTGFVGMGNKPTPLRDEEVAGIMKRMESEAPKVKVTFKPGQKVRIIDGPFNDFLGVVDEIDMDKAKARVMVSFFGRDTPVELDFLQVEKM